MKDIWGYEDIILKLSRGQRTLYSGKLLKQSTKAWYDDMIWWYEDIILKLSRGRRTMYFGKLLKQSAKALKVARRCCSSTNCLYAFNSCAKNTKNKKYKTQNTEYKILKKYEIQKYWIRNTKNKCRIQVKDTKCKLQKANKCKYKIQNKHK